MLHVRFDQPGTGDDFLSAMVNSIEASINMYFGVARPVISILILPPGLLDNLPNSAFTCPVLSAYCR